MTRDELEAEALKLEPRERARLAERLLASLENLTVAENTLLWALEAERRDAEWDSMLDAPRPPDEVFKNARSRLR